METRASVLAHIHFGLFHGSSWCVGDGGDCEMSLKLITSILIFVGEHPLQDQMKQAVRRIKLEEIRSDAVLCQETIRAMRILKKKKNSR